jgi:hypothetical protein
MADSPGRDVPIWSVDAHLERAGAARSRAHGPAIRRRPWPDRRPVRVVDLDRRPWARVGALEPDVPLLPASNKAETQRGSTRSRYQCRPTLASQTERSSDAGTGRACRCRQRNRSRSTALGAATGSNKSSATRRVAASTRIGCLRSWRQEVATANCHRPGPRLSTTARGPFGPRGRRQGLQAPDCIETDCPVWSDPACPRGAHNGDAKAAQPRP